MRLSKPHPPGYRLPRGWGWGGFAGCRDFFAIFSRFFNDFFAVFLVFFFFFFSSSTVFDGFFLAGSMGSPAA